MSIAKEMVAAAIECVRTPGHISIWSKSLGKYVCRKDPEFNRVMAEQSTLAIAKASPAPLSSAFKLVFLTAAGGTLLFVLICVGTRLVAGTAIPPLLDKTLDSLFDLAKIGFGAITGMLASHTLRG